MSKRQRILHAAESKLDDSSHLFRRTITCRYAHGVLRLDGKVPSFYLKQMAQSLMQDIDGVEQVDNALIVANPYGVSGDSVLVTAESGSEPFI